MASPFYVKWEEWVQITYSVPPNESWLLYHLKYQTGITKWYQRFKYKSFTNHSHFITINHCSLQIKNFPLCFPVILNHEHSSEHEPCRIASLLRIQFVEVKLKGWFFHKFDGLNDSMRKSQSWFTKYFRFLTSDCEILFFNSPPFRCQNWSPTQSCRSLPTNERTSERTSVCK